VGVAAGDPRLRRRSPAVRLPSPTCGRGVGGEGSAPQTRCTLRDHSAPQHRLCDSAEACPGCGRCLCGFAEAPPASGDAFCFVQTHIRDTEAPLVLRRETSQTQERLLFCAERLLKPSTASVNPQTHLPNPGAPLRTRRPISQTQERLCEHLERFSKRGDALAPSPRPRCLARRRLHPATSTTHPWMIGLRPHGRASSSGESARCQERLG
jgi:hypothetical protein